MGNAKTLGLVIGALTAVGAQTLSADAGCRMAGGSAFMVTQGLAEFMAKAALKNSISDHGWRPAGPIKLSCKADLATTTCYARRRACD